METTQKALYIDSSTGFYKVRRYKVGEYFGPVDLGLHISGRTQSLNFGVGLFAGSIFPGSNRMMFTGFSPAWRGFYVSSMGGAGLEFDNLGINQVSLVGKSPVPAVLYLNRRHGEEIEVEDKRRRFNVIDRHVQTARQQIMRQEDDKIFELLDAAGKK